MTSERKVVVITEASRGIVTIPGMPCINHDQYDIDGIRVERFTTAPKDAAQRPPLICVHGGCHASWSWQEHAPVYAAAGYEVHALNWRGRGGSAAINDDSFVKMSIADVVDDIDKVARCFDTPPVLIAHSMGGLAAQLYASAHEVDALVLLTPVVPSNVGATPHELPIGDMDAPWGPPPPDVARQMFFQGLDDMQAAHFYALLVPESPLRVYEATRWSLAVDATKLTAPINVAYGRHCGKSQQGRPSHTVRLQSASGCQERCAPLPLPALPTRSLWLFLATEWSAKTVRWLAIAGG
jgi:pimeloyl-ACP methyl ester carboxylesterase